MDSPLSITFKNPLYPECEPATGGHHADAQR